MSTKTRATTGGYEPRFDITRTDGQPVDPSRRYMVMSFDGSDPAGVEAVKRYAKRIRYSNPELYRCLVEMLDDPASAPAQHRWAK